MREESIGPHWFLRHSAWRRYFGRDTDVVGRAVEIDGQPAVVCGGRVRRFVAASRLGRCVAVRGRNATLNALPSASLGYVLGHVTHSAYGAETRGGQWHMLVPREGGYDGFDCVSLTERISAALLHFLFALMLACLALPGDHATAAWRLPEDERITFLGDPAAAMDLSFPQNCADPAHCLLRFA